MTNYNKASEILKKQRAIQNQKVEEPIDNRDVIFIQSNYSKDTEQIVKSICEELSLVPNTIIQNHLYSIKVNIEINEKMEREINELLNICSDIREHTMSYSEKLSESTSLYATLSHSNDVDNHINDVNVSKEYKTEVNNSNKYLQNISKENWVNEITDYIFSTSINVEKNDLKKYISYVFEYHCDLILDKSFKGVENNSLYALTRNPLAEKRTKEERALQEAFSKLDQKLRREISKYERKNSCDLEREINNQAQKATGITGMSLKGLSEYRKADKNSEPTIEISEKFPKWQGIKTTGIMREDIFEFFTLNYISNCSFKNTRTITRAVTNSAMSWAFAQNHKKMVEHIEHCIKTNAKEDEVLSILS